jgi:hypothetical protein
MRAAAVHCARRTGYPYIPDVMKKPLAISAARAYRLERNQGYLVLLSFVQVAAP